MADYLDNKLAEKNKKQEDLKEHPPVPDEDYEWDVETYLYDIKKPMEFINEGEHGVFDIKRQTGINTAKSVFDKGAAFKTN